MRKIKTALKATGKRWLKKIKCPNCKGTKKQNPQEQIQCTQCSGIGYVEDIKKNEVICQKCKGHRVVTQKSDTDCVDCKGKGYLSKIMQRFSSKKACKKCLGKGDVTTKLINCNDCDGDGWVYPAQIYSFEDWEKSPNFIQVNNSDHESRSSSGSRIIFKKCSECCYHPKKRCPICKGLGKIVEVCPGCIRCAGSGKVEGYDNIKCDECQGSGTITVYVDREV